ncbi:GNAT family N-acetyltransferase [Kutzneria sp. NPDC051319]|uniref:GNAT family N-acetyltransferase n=1 Tax=Kutzneria sp. NPDC051319 TaxID=3155047 RepID=UPI00342BCBD4
MEPQTDIGPCDPNQADEATLAEYYELMVASAKIDRPHEPTTSYEAVIGRLRRPGPGAYTMRYWFAYQTGKVVGHMTLSLPMLETPHLASIEITVHPDFRRRGIGSDFLRTLFPVLHAEARTTVEGWWITGGSVGEQWALARGFQLTHAAVGQRLALQEVDPSLWAIEPPAGYRIQQWIGHAPDALLASYADARAAIHDAPLGQAVLESPEWTPDRVRLAEQVLRADGVEQRVVVAVHEGSGTVAGLTELKLPPYAKGVAQQQDTAVLSAHRGHGIGACIKAYMIRWLLASRPDITAIRTTTGARNVHMIRINHALGFVTVRSWVVVTGELSNLEARLSS